MLRAAGVARRTSEAREPLREILPLVLSLFGLPGRPARRVPLRKPQETRDNPDG